MTRTEPAPPAPSPPAQPLVAQPSRAVQLVPTLPDADPGPHRRRTVRLLLLAALLAAAGGAWWFLTQPPLLAVVQPWRGKAIEAVYATGVVEAVDSARVGTTVAGRIVTLAVDEGAAVSRGQVLAQLDDRQAQQRLADAQARLALAEQELARDEALARSGVRSAQQVQRSIQTRDTALAAVALAARQIEDYRIASPLDGVVVKRPVEPGETVTANAVLFELAAPGRLRIAADVDERDIPQVHLGAQVAIRAEGFPGQAFAAAVTNIRPRGETTTRSFRVEADLPAGTGLLMGMTVDVNVVVAERDNAVLVPPTAVRHAAPSGGQPGAAHVWRLEDGRARRTPVQTGAIGPAAVELRAGADPAMTLLADPPADLADGARVAARP